MTIKPGTRLGPYEVTGAVGAGGMGVVYAAIDTRLGRRVAIKLLPPEAAADPERRRRFMVEARAASALNHPNIAQVYDLVDIPPEGGRDAGAQDPDHALVMELVEGTPLDQVIAGGRPAVAQALDVAMQVAGALDAAHAAGIVHRDIKPANIMIDREGRVKVLDFGIAKLAEAGGDTAGATMTSAGTRLGMILGTAAYMSPEQAEGRPVDARSDLFSLGGVLYEMLAGRRAFTGDTDLGVLGNILHAAPPPLAGVPRDVDSIVRRALQKSPDARYAGAAAMRADLSSALARLSAPKPGAAWRQPSVLALVGLALVAILGYGVWQAVRARGERWARQEAMPQLEHAQFTRHTIEAVQLARAAEKYLPDDVARVRQAWIRFRIDTTPAGAHIEMKNYNDVSSAWDDFGVSPAVLVIPMGYYRVRLTKPGFAPLEIGAMSRNQSVTLTPLPDVHAGMLPVAGGDASHGVAGSVRLSPFWIGRLEVTNREYQRFVDAGGYADPKYWTEPFRRGSGVESFAEAITQFRDTTNRPGPSTWELGRFPDGQGDYPVGGISWFEAAAYARFAGARLPSIYHWFQASGADEIYSDILVLSNFDGKGPVRAGERAGVGPFGTLDMAGNVKEWCSNEAAGTTRRYILGGGWNEPSYRFTEAEARDSWERGPTFGVRVIQDAAAPPAADLPVEQIVPDPNTIVPVPDTAFEFIKKFYTYDRTPLDARIATVDDSSPDWRKETISIAAAYGGERVPAYFFTPKHATPPYQTIVFFPTSYARTALSSDRLDLAVFDFLIKSGRAVLYPVYQGTFERRSSVSTGPSGLRDMSVQWAKDFFRSVDYLVTRDDVDKDRLAYYSVSMGSYFAPIPLALEPRIKTAVLIAGGLRFNYPDEVQPANFMPHVHVPTLLLNGRDDFGSSLEAEQRYLALLGTPEKKHVVLDGGHVPGDWREVIRETLDWYDKYLGPVK